LVCVIYFWAYLLFPFLYGWLKDKLNWRGCLSLLAITVGIEFAYRAIALYWFDGLPISYDDQRFLAIFPNSVEPLDHHVDWFFGFFQRRAPFGFIFSRLGEFVLGMLLAVALINDRSKANQRLLNLPMGVTGAVIWLVGQALMYVGLWGWIFSDFFITLGLILWTLNLAGFLQKISPTVFRTMTFLGMWSYYIYLVHQPFTRGARGVALMFVDPDAGMLVEIFANLLCLGLAAGCTAIASFLLMRFDTSRLADRMFARISQLVSVQNIQKIVSSK
jgi:peptidoglycan/LPS O-acetylase OafA/YrhL